MFEHEAGCGVVTDLIGNLPRIRRFGVDPSRAAYCFAVPYLIAESCAVGRAAGQYRALPGVLGKGIASRTLDRPVT
jgi:hypothetical protein